MAIMDLEQRIGVNPFEKGIVVDKKPERVQNVELTIDEAVERTILQYQQIDFSIFPRQQIDRLNVETLNPYQIGRALFGILAITDPFILKRYTAKLYLSKLVQSSYNAGNNNFVLEGKNPLVSLRELEGTKQNPIHITITGSVAEGFGISSKYCIFDIEGNTGDCLGQSSKNCIYSINGNVGDRCGEDSSYSSYIIKRNVGNGCGHLSKYCTFDINGNAGFSCGGSMNSNYTISGNVGGGIMIYSSRNCTYTICGTIKNNFDSVFDSTFVVMNKKSYNFLVKNLSATNIIHFVDNNKNLILETRK